MFGESVTRSRRTAGALDRYGVPTYTWVSSTLDGFAFDPGGSLEPVEVGRESVVTTPKLYSLVAVDLTARDRVVVRGLTYTVEGDPAVWVAPWSSRTAGVVVELRRVAG